MIPPLHEPDHEYHAREAWTAHKVIEFSRCPKAFHESKAGNPLFRRDFNPAFSFGKLVHLLVLEPHRRAEVVVSDGPVNEKTGKPYGSETQAFKAWLADQGGKTIASTADMARAEWCAVEVAAALHACKIDLAGCHREASFIRPDEDLGMVQCRPDAYDQAGEAIYDLKTTSDMDGFKFDINRYGYRQQAAWYRFVLNRPELRWRWIVVESKAPFRVRIYKETAEQRSEGNQRLRDVIAALKSCLASNAWPNSLTGYEFDA